MEKEREELWSGGLILSTKRNRIFGRSNLWLIHLECCVNDFGPLGPGELSCCWVTDLILTTVAFNLWLIHLDIRGEGARGW